MKLKKKCRLYHHSINLRQICMLQWFLPSCSLYIIWSALLIFKRLRKERDQQCLEWLGRASQKPYKDLDRRKKSTQYNALVKCIQALKSVTAPSLAGCVTLVKLVKILASVFLSEKWEQYYLIRTLRRKCM